MRHLPTGTVTFLFTDIEGSTRLLGELGAEGYSAALVEHRRQVRAAFTAHGGVEVDTQGDAFFVAFPDAAAAVRAAQQAQEALASGPIRVRMGLHTGTPHVGPEGYVGGDVHLGARIAAAGHGGQVLVSKATVQAVGDGFELTELGEHRLKDIATAVPIFQLGTERFPPLKTISNTNLPRPASSFVGREREVEEVTALLRDGARLLTLTGPGGTGKTRLSIESASELVAEFRAGVFWVPLAALRDHTLVSDTIARTLGAQDGLAEHIGEREMLLVVDNLEQVVAAAPELASLVESCPNLRVLTTSRELLRVRGEVEYPVPPLADPDAVELFATRSGLAADETIAELCRRLENLPLAVELAAARARVLTPAQILERLSGRLDLLKGGRDADPRQQTLRAAIEWSHDLLAADERALFARLAVFRGGCTLDAAEEVVDADLDTLQALVDKSLVRRTGERFWMLETIREFAVERLEASGQTPSLRDRHAAYFLALAERSEPHLIGPGSAPWQDRLEAELENLRLALDHLEESGDVEKAMHLAGTITEFWDQRSHHAEALTRFRRLLSMGQGATLARAKALDGASMLTTKTTDLPQAKRWAQESLAIHRRLGDPGGAAIALWNLGYIGLEDGDHAAAERYLAEAVTLLRNAGQEAAGYWANRTLAFNSYLAGDLDRSQELYEENLSWARATGDHELASATLAGLSSIALDRGNLAEAISIAQDETRVVDELDHLLRLQRLSNIAMVLARVGQPATAAQLVALVAEIQKEFDAQEAWVEKMNHETVASASEQLGEAVFDQLWAEGRKLSEKRATELASAALEEAARVFAR